MKVMNLTDLLQNIPGLNKPDAKKLRIDRICYDSRRTEKNSLFVAIKGYRTDGHEYIQQAAENGAAAAVVETPDPAVSIPQVVVPDSRIALARLAARFYSPELAKMRVVGITGTNGKTTTSFLVRAVLQAGGIPSGLIGTIMYRVGEREIKAWNTTPESVDLFDMMYQMYTQDQKGCVIEVSSHALELNRVDGLGFEIAIFTNLSQDHLDFHSDLETYFQVKSKLFSLLNPRGCAVINISDPYGRRLEQTVKAEKICFGTDENALIHPLEWHSTLDGTSLLVKTPAGKMHIKSPLIGKFNVENILAAVSAGIAADVNPDRIREGIESVQAIPGRLEPVREAAHRSVLVDYSHTPDALEKALQVLSSINRGRLWVVFGCGGDRDRGKRPLMGKIAYELADHVVVTSDNPRSENPESIINEILGGIPEGEATHVEPDRKEAIRFVLENSQKGDTILIAGKGHEDYQEIKGVKYPFDDREIIRDLLK